MSHCRHKQVKKIYTVRIYGTEIETINTVYWGEGGGAGSPVLYLPPKYTRIQDSNISNEPWPCSIKSGGHFHSIPVVCSLSPFTYSVCQNRNLQTLGGGGGGELLVKNGKWESDRIGSLSLSV